MYYIVDNTNLGAIGAGSITGIQLFSLIIPQNWMGFIGCGLRADVFDSLYEWPDIVTGPELTDPPFCNGKCMEVFSKYC